MEAMRLKASLKAAAYGLIALLGYSNGLEAIKQVLREIENEAWRDR